MATRFRLPTITNAYTAVGNELVGELAFNTDTQEQVQWDGSAWVALSSGRSGGLDGGSANSVYLVSQTIDGGTANG